MEKEVIGYCPACSNKLVATKLTCKACHLDITGDFQLSKYSYLTKDEQKYLALFLQSEGSFKDVQAELGITYQRAKQILSNILVKLDLKEEREDVAKMKFNRAVHPEYVQVNDDDHFVVKSIKDRLNKAGGHARIPMISAGKVMDIWYDSDDNGLECDKIPVPNQLTWEVFIAAYSIAAAQEGTLYKGYARSGKLGSDKLPLDSLEGYVAHAVHGVEEGKSAFSPGFAIAAILDWAGIFINERGSTIKLVSKNVFVDSYKDALENAKTFIEGLNHEESIVNKLNNYRHWYYFEELDGFAPSKFIGYKQMDMRAYQASSSIELNGMDTEKALRNLFIIAEGGCKNELQHKLEKFLSNYGKHPNVLTKIHVKKDAE